MKLPPRIYSLDVARGFAALSVVLWHWQHFYVGENGLPADFDRSEQPLYGLLGMFYEMGGVAVAFFFTLSGFVFFWLYRKPVSERECSAWRFAVLRFARLYPLHLVTLVAVAVLQIAFFALTSRHFIYQDNDGFHFVLQLFFGSSWGFERGISFNGPVWSVSLEIGLYTVFFVIAYLRLSGWKSLLVLIAGAFGMKQMGIGGGWPPALFSFFLGGLTCYAVTAYIASRWHSRAIDRLVILSALLLWGALACSQTVVQFVRDSPYRPDLVVLFPLTIGALVIYECSKQGVFKRVRWIGDITYATYLLHFPLQLAFVIAFARLGAEASLFHSPWMLGCFFLVLVSLSWVTFRYFERPMQSAIRRRLLAKTGEKGAEHSGKTSS